MPITIDVKDSDIFKDGRKEGRKEGKRQGRKEGKRQGRKEGIKEGKEEGLIAGLIEGIELGLELKFSSAALELMPLVRAVDCVDKLEEFKNLIKTATAVDELKGFLGQSTLSQMGH
ncbi:MAG: hypothetical protein HQK97_02250 [Nitrospirae bacterium]|nr:hypothetical protein [Nitrospirota bacterium]